MLMNTKRIWTPTRFFVLLVAGLVSFGATTIRAQDAPSNDQNATYDAQGDDNYNAPENGQDPPSRVARLSYLDGSVSFQPGGQGDWGEATRNRPVTIGDKIWADNNSRAELQAGQASIHLSSNTALSFLNLDEQTTQMRLAEGSINFRIRELREGDVYEVDTPNLSFNVTQAGAFRIDVNENGDGIRVTAIRGEGEVTANGQTYTIHAGERGEFNGTDNVTYFISGAPQPDAFDRWASDRDLREDNSVSSRYVSRDVPGYSDLDDNGTWNEEPDYGPVWYPSTVDVGWAPYSSGYWSYVGPWGWTWVDYAPWGFAPFHYGRWAYIGSRWGWCPGPYYARPIYGPAFVGFIGGSHWGAGFGFGGGIGWFPLGPREPFHPWYHASSRYYRNVNFNNTFIRNSTIINNRTNNFNYAYSHNARAVTVASHNNFVNGRAINRGAFHVTEASLHGAQVSNRTNFTPTRQSYFGAARTHGNIARPSAAIQNRPVMARTSPAAGASHMPVRTFGGNSQPGRGGFNNGSFSGSRAPVMGRTAETGAAANRNRPSFAQGGQPNAAGPSRQQELSNNKPQSHIRNVPGDSRLNGGGRGQPNVGNNRNWSAQGNSTDRGRAPSGFGSNSARGTSMNHPDRPSWASDAGGSNNTRSGSSVSPRSNASGNRPDYTNANRGNSRSYQPPQRSPGYSNDRPQSNSNSNANSNRGFSQPPRSYGESPQRSPGYSNNRPQYNSNSNANSNRGFSQPPRSYSAPQRTYSPPSQSRGYSAPSRSYSPPSRGYSAPSQSLGGGGSNRGGGGSYGGGGSHGNGGGGGGPRSSGSGGGGSRGGGAPHGGAGGSSRGSASSHGR
jgi:hypothetical protein